MDENSVEKLFNEICPVFVFQYVFKLSFFSWMLLDMHDFCCFNGQPDFQLRVIRISIVFVAKINEQ